MEIFRVENLSFRYPSSDKKALENISLEISQGEFVVVCGHSGCGKTTLLKMLKKQLTPFGDRKGNVFYCGQDVSTLDDNVSARKIGFVMQDPESQIVTDKVWHELSFGLENLGMPTSVIRRRIGEISNYFGIEDIFEKNVTQLSGGQKQMLNLASVMAMDPKVLILDEPTSQLDPIAAAEFISTLKKINRERFVSVIIAEHTLEDLICEADKLVVMKDAKIISCGSPQEVCKNISDESVLAGMPVPVRLYNKFPLTEKCPLNVKDGRTFLENSFKNDTSSLPLTEPGKNENIALEIKDVYFRYEKNSHDVLKNISLKVYENEVLCILGGNASGKTTLLKNIASIIRPYRGEIKFPGEKRASGKGFPKRKIAYLAQNPNDLFIKETVMEDFEYVSENDDEIALLAKKFKIEKLLNKHPYDLSFGELQRCAIVKVLLTNPDVIALDEPTKGIDAFSKNTVIDVIKDLKKSGKTVVIATHDTDFAAACASRCAFLFSGEIVSCDVPEKFFSDNVFYTTASSRLSRDYYFGAVTVERLIKLCEINGRK